MRSSTLFSSGTFCGTIARIAYPFADAIAARLIPVLPLVGSTIPLPAARVSPRLSSPRSSRSRIISDAARSLIEPNGLSHSSLAYNSNAGLGFIFPMRTKGEGFSSLGSISKILSYTRVWWFMVSHRPAAPGAMPRVERTYQFDRLLRCRVLPLDSRQRSYAQHLHSASALRTHQPQWFKSSRSMPRLYGRSISAHPTSHIPHPTSFHLPEKCLFTSDIICSVRWLCTGFA